MGHRLWATGASSQLWYSDDGGDNWTQASGGSAPTGWLSDVAGPKRNGDHKVYFASGGQGVYRYDDTNGFALEDAWVDTNVGVTWTQGHTPVYCNRDDTLVIVGRLDDASAGYYNVIRTRVGAPGTSWTTEYQGPGSPEWETIWDVHGSSNGDHVYALAVYDDASHVGILQRSGGGSWSEAAGVSVGGAITAVRAFRLRVMEDGVVLVFGERVESGVTYLTVWRWRSSVWSTLYSYDLGGVGGGNFAGADLDPEGVNGIIAYDTFGGGGAVWYGSWYYWNIEDSDVWTSHIFTDCCTRGTYALSKRILQSDGEFIRRVFGSPPWVDYSEEDIGTANNTYALGYTESTMLVDNTLWDMGSDELWYSFDKGDTWESTRYDSGYERYMGGLWGPKNSWKVYVQVDSSGIHYYDGTWHLEDSFASTYPFDHWASTDYIQSMWCDDEDTIVCATGQGEDAELIRVRDGGPGTSWATEYTGNVSEYEVPTCVHGCPDGSAIFATTYGWTGTEYYAKLLKRQPGGTWTTETTWNPPIFGNYGLWQVVRVVSATEVYISGQYYNGSDYVNLVWKWNGSSLSIDYTSPGDGEFEGMWMAPDGSEILVVEQNIGSSPSPSFTEVMHRKESGSWSWQGWEMSPVSHHPAQFWNDKTTGRDMAARGEFMRWTVANGWANGYYAADPSPWASGDVGLIMWYQDYDYTPGPEDYVRSKSESTTAVDSLDAEKNPPTWSFRRDEEVTAVDAAAEETETLDYLHVHLGVRYGFFATAASSRRIVGNSWVTDNTKGMEAANQTGHYGDFKRLNNHYMAGVFGTAAESWLLVWDNGVWSSYKMPDSPYAIRLYIRAVDDILILSAENLVSANDQHLWHWNGSDFYDVLELGFANAVDYGGLDGVGADHIVVLGAEVGGYKFTGGDVRDPGDWAAFSRPGIGSNPLTNFKVVSASEYYATASFYIGGVSAVYEWLGASWAGTGSFPGYVYSTSAWCVTKAADGTLWAMGSANPYSWDPLSTKGSTPKLLPDRGPPTRSLPSRARHTRTVIQPRIQTISSSAALETRTTKSTSNIWMV